MHLIDVPLDQLAALGQHLNPTSLFEALILARSAGNIRSGRFGASPPPLTSSVASNLNATVASSREELKAAGELVMRRYAWRGYMVDARALDHPAPGESTSAAITFIANDAAGETVGTLTLGLDGPSGLSVDDTYRSELDAVRGAGRRVCELTRLAVDEGAHSKSVLAALFSHAYLLGRVLHRATDVFIEVNPRHVAFYERALGFVVAAGERICERVKAPSVLLRLEAEKLEGWLRDFGFRGIDDWLVAA
jgi:N-acyl amino acid synthase FeeM